MKMFSIDEAKARLPIHAVLSRIGRDTGIPEQEGKNFPCPFGEDHANGDRSASCNIYRGRLHCFSNPAHCGDQCDILALHYGVPKEDGISKLMELAGGETFTAHAAPRIAIRAREFEPDPVITLPSDLTSGFHGDCHLWHTLAKLRRVSVHAVSLAVRMGVIRFGTVCGHHSWILTDGRRRMVEARRMDGQFYPAIGAMGERKSHALKGAKKDWPVGIQSRMPADKFEKILVCEGMPDLLAAYHFIEVTGTMDALPVAILGRGNRKIHHDALKMFRGKTVRIFPHADTDGGGVAVAEDWSRQIQEAGAVYVDRFDFTGLSRIDGKPVNDLNDCTVICEADKPELKGLLP